MIAVAIWYRYSLTSNAGVTQVFERKLKIVNKEPQLAVSHRVEDGRVRITLSGRRLDLMQVENQLAAQVDMKLVKSALGEVAPPVEAVFPPELNLKVVNIEPRVVRITVRSADPQPRAEVEPSAASRPLD